MRVRSRCRGHVGGGRGWTPHVERSRAGGRWRGGFLPILAIVAVAGLPSGVEAQVINEVIASNGTQEPIDVGNGHTDMVEIYNDTSETITLGFSDITASYMLSDVPASEDPPAFDETRAWPFPGAGRATITSRGRLVVFCDGNDTQGTCELHASFNLNNDGSESVVLWGPEEPGGSRPVVDRVFLAPLDRDVSFGRFPDGAGGANVPLAETFDHFVYYGPGRTSFGGCTAIAGLCLVEGSTRRRCSGAPNLDPSAADNLAPSIVRLDQSTNAPAAGEPVRLTARVRDDEIPTPGNIAAVEVIYRVKRPGDADFGAEAVVAMEWDATLGEGGVLTNAARGRPLDRFTHWNAEIPGQSAGSQVEFYFRVSDAQGLMGTRPTELCHLHPQYGEGIGPCDREFGPESNGCARDLEDVTCQPGAPDEPPDPVGDGGGAVAVTGERYFACNVRSAYHVAYTPPADLSAVLINEIVPSQTRLLTDATELPCNVSSSSCENSATPRCCPADHPECCRQDEDFIELINTSDQPVDLSGCFLSDSPFDPQRWRFPAGSMVPAATRVIVWMDRDGSRCPEPARLDKPCFWECPDPNVQSMQFNPPEFHTNFGLDADGDQIFLYDRAENGFGLIHGFDFGNPSEICGFVSDPAKNPTQDILPDQSVSLLPDGSRSGRFAIVDTATPKAGNQGECVQEVSFRRGDANADGVPDIADAVFTLGFLFLGGPAPKCFDAADSDDNSTLELTDAVFLLNFLFLGGPPPRVPGPADCGPDPTEDLLAECTYDRCD